MSGRHPMWRCLHTLRTSVIWASGAARFSVKRILLMLALLLSGAAAAEQATDAEYKQLEGQLLSLQHEQQSVYQQFQMTQEMRRTELQMLYPPVVQNSPDYNMNNPPPNYDDVAREKADREYRIKQ